MKLNTNYVGWNLCDLAAALGSDADEPLYGAQWYAMAAFEAATPEEQTRLRNESEYFRPRNY